MLNCYFVYLESPDLAQCDSGIHPKIVKFNVIWEGITFTSPLAFAARVIEGPVAGIPMAPKEAGKWH